MSSRVELLPGRRPVRGVFVFGVRGLTKKAPESPLTNKFSGSGHSDVDDRSPCHACLGAPLRTPRSDRVMSETGRHRVVVIGGGFGGLQAVAHLRRAQVDVTLIDRRNFHLFQPLTYQVATGALSPEEV